MPDDVALRSYLRTEPLWWQTCTILAYLAADAVSARLGRHPLANPVLIAVGLLVPLVIAVFL